MRITDITIKWNKKMKSTLFTIGDKIAVRWQYLQWLYERQ